MIRYIMTYFKTWGKPMLVLGGLILFSSVGYHTLMYIPMLNSLLFLVAIFSTLAAPLLPGLFIALGLFERNWVVRLGLWAISLVGILDTINSISLRQGGYDLPFPHFENANNAIFLDVFLFPTPLIGIVFFAYGLFCYFYRFRGTEIQQEAKLTSDENMRTYWTKQFKKKRGCLLTIFVPCLPLILMSGWWIYVTDYELTEVYRDHNSVTGHTLLFQQVGDPGWPFGPTKVKLTLLDENNRKIETIETYISDDGANSSEENISINWLGHSVRVTLSGDEQQDEVHVLEFN